MTRSKPKGDTSDSEAERKQPKAAVGIPTVISPTPDVETLSNMSRSVSPTMIPASASRGNLRVDGLGIGRPPSRSPHNTFISNLSGDHSDEPSFRGSHGLSKSYSNGSAPHPPFTFGTSPRSLSSGKGFDSPIRRQRNLSVSVASIGGPSTERYSAYSNAPGHPTPMTRTASDGADMLDSGAEWPLSTSTGSRKPLPNFESPPTAVSESPRPPERARRHSLQGRSEYRGLRVSDPQLLAVDVELCETVWRFMAREAALRQRADDMAQMERSAFVATQKILDAVKARRAEIAALEKEVSRLRAGLHRAAHEDVEEDRDLQWASSKIEFFLSEDTNTPELSWGLRELEKHWEALRNDYAKNMSGLRQWGSSASPPQQTQQQQQQQQPARLAIQNGNGSGHPTGVISGLLSRIGL